MLHGGLDTFIAIARNYSTTGEMLKKELWKKSL